MTTELAEQVAQVLGELRAVAKLTANDLLVLGVSTSEVGGAHIGTSSSGEVAAAILQGVEKVRKQHPFHLAVQCCEHLNRALVVERRTLEQFGLTEVSVVPVPSAGGAMAAHAYRQLPDAAVVENVQAHAGIDIGDTLIGMHLRPVVVPVRPTLQTIGRAHVTMARTRPKLIGGARAVYA